MTNYPTPITSTAGLKKTVILRSTSGRVKQSLILRRAITAYEQSKITLPKLWQIYRELQ